MRVLITGLNTYLGRRAVSHLSSDDFEVVGLVRNLNFFHKRFNEPLHASLKEMDLLKPNSSFQNFCIEQLDLGIYFTQVPQLNDQINMQIELLSLRNFIQLCKQNACNRVVYIARLMDSKYIDAIRTLFEECRIRYTVVLKSSAIGKGTLLSEIFEKLSKNKFIPYWKFVGDLKFKPISLLDVYRWIREMPWEDSFISEVIYFGGEESLDYKKLFNRYMHAYHPENKYSYFPINKWLTKFTYTNFFDIHKENFDEFRRIMRYEGDVDNSTWKKRKNFQFTPIVDSLLLDK